MKNRAIAPIALSLLAAGLAALAMTLFAPHWFQPMVRVVACYDLAVIVILIWYWSVILRTNTSNTKVRAAAQDPGRDAIFTVILLAVAFGFAAAFDILGPGPHDRIARHEVLIFASGFGAVVLGWLLVHTIFSFRYAHLYYGDRDRNNESDRGLVFPGRADPSYCDLAYFSFVIGMTFQVSDVQITDQRIRRLVLGHGLISFGYNTAILALVVNVVSNLLHG
jgi:uncharacterized membrane protein